MRMQKLLAHGSSDHPCRVCRER